MYIIVDDRNMVAGGYANGFDREGVSSAGIEASEFREWIGKISDTDMNAVEAFVIGDCNEREALSRLIRERSSAPLLCLNERQSLDDTLGLFAAGADDVLRKPVHVREIVARVGAINRRVFGENGNVTVGELRVYFDGREPEVNGDAVSSSAPGAADPRVSAALSRSARQQDANLQRRLWAVRRGCRRERDREPHQQVAQETQASAGFRPDRFQAVPRLLHREIGRLTRVALNRLCERSEGARKSALSRSVLSRTRSRSRPQRRAALLAAPACDEKPRAPLRRHAAFPFPISPLPNLILRPASSIRPPFRASA